MMAKIAYKVVLLGLIGFVGTAVSQNEEYKRAALARIKDNTAHFQDNADFDGRWIFKTACLSSHVQTSSTYLKNIEKMDDCTFFTEDLIFEIDIVGNWKKSESASDDSETFYSDLVRKFNSSVIFDPVPKYLFKSTGQYVLSSGAASPLDEYFGEPIMATFKHGSSNFGCGIPKGTSTFMACTFRNTERIDDKTFKEAFITVFLVRPVLN